MAARTRLGADGYGVRRAGSFGGKTGPELDLTINPKWFRPAAIREFDMIARPRPFATGARLRSFDGQGKP
jgi:hypothetical protein